MCQDRTTYNDYYKEATPNQTKLNRKLISLIIIRFQHNVVGEEISLKTVSGVFIHSIVTRVNTAILIQHHHQQQHPSLHLVRMIITVHLDISASMKFVFLFLRLH